MHRTTHPTRPILLVDDNPLHLDSIQARLERSGFWVITESNACDAIRRAHKEHPKIILSDIRMPRMDGFSLCQQIRQDRTLCDVPIVLYSVGEIDEATVQRAHALRAQTITVQSINPAPLVGLVQSIWARLPSDRAIHPPHQDRFSPI